MAFKLNSGTAIKATPNVEAPTLDVFPEAILFGTGKKFTDDHQVEWVNVYFPPPDQDLDGWIKTTDGQPVPDPTPPPLDPEMFVRRCTLIDRMLNSDPAVSPNFVSADFLIARAIIETGMAWTVFAAPFCTGPFRLAEREWKAFLEGGLQTHDQFKLEDVNYPWAQICAAAHSMHVAGKNFAAAWQAGTHPAVAPNPLFPAISTYSTCI
jgi:hypothetical protein